MPQANQIAKRNEIAVTRDELLEIPRGPITEKGLRQNFNVGVLYLEAWLSGSGAVPLYNLMEDAATAEISRTQIWQWIHHGAKLDDGRPIDGKLYKEVRDDELAEIGPRDNIHAAVRIFDELILSDTLADFLTVPAYDELLKRE